MHNVFTAKGIMPHVFTAEHLSRSQITFLITFEPEGPDNTEKELGV